MAKPEWGVKRLCANCGARFYDLMLDPITCPECGTVFEVAALVRGKRPRPSGGRAEGAKKAVLGEEADELELDVDLEDADVDDDDDVVLDDDADEADDVAVPGPAAGVDVEDDALDTDDSVLIEEDEDDEVPRDDFDTEEEDDDTRR